MANSVGPDEMARYEPSHQELRCLHMYLFLSTRLEELRKSEHNVNELFLFYHSIFLY